MHSYHPNIRVDRDDLVATVTIDRPKSRNGCTGGMWVAIGRTFTDLSQSGVRAIVLTGANENFCSGADLAGGGGGDDGGGSGGGKIANMTDSMRVLADVVLAVHSCAVPVIAKVDGLCVGAGIGLALAADLTYCSDRARFSVIFAKRGLSLDFGTSWLLRQRIGVHKAKELALTAKIISGAEAHAMGFVNAVFPADELDASVDEIVATIASGPPIALQATKRELDLASEGSLARALEVEALAQAVNVQTDDLREALTAFFEKRAPKFTGK